MVGTAEAVRGENPSAEEPTAVDEARVRAHVAQILASGDFAAAPQLAAFLRYIVDKKLSGEEQFIKAYTIATEALGRAPDFDAQNDPIVRVQARRLRQSLMLYYADPAADPSLRIVLPVGGYVPEFTIPQAAAEPLAVTQAVQAEAKSTSKPLFETRWIAPVSLILSMISMVLSLWPGVIKYLLGQ